MQKAALAAIAWLVTGTASLPDPAIDIVNAEPVALDRADPARDRIGQLRYLGGWILTSRQPRFGGYSALYVKGDQFTALADTGEYLTFQMRMPGVIGDAKFGRLPGCPGQKGIKSDCDSESMTVDPASGTTWVGFEQYNAIFRFAPDFAGAEAVAAPPAMSKWPANAGPETLARLSDGRFITIGEGARIGPTSKMEALLFAGDPTDPIRQPVPFIYRPPRGYVPTDAQQLPDGRIVVLNRHFELMDGMWAALTVFDPATIVAEQLVHTELIAELKPPLTVDNMEGLSITQENGRPVLWLISDDNQNGIQKTLLLKFVFGPIPR
jgi:hypothetical protein